MKTGFRGTFVISWVQTEIDGLESAPSESLTVGSAWSWHGDAVRVDGPNDLLQLDGADGEAGLRKRAARKVKRLIGAAVNTAPEPVRTEIEEPISNRSFVVTDGKDSFTVTIVDAGPGMNPLLMFLDELPPRDVDLWVVHQSSAVPISPEPGSATGGVICFTPGTLISTPAGQCPVEELCEGDKVRTRDGGSQEIQWIGSRRMTGARLFAMPRLRPILISAGALGIERPEQELLVSPEHRMLVRGPAARALFNTPEVLVAAKDLVNGSTITVDLSVREVNYIHILLPSHQVIWANGVETESFHPANAALESLGEQDQSRLLSRYPDLERDPYSYGGYARRNLSTSEAAILRHEAA